MWFCHEHDGVCDFESVPPDQLMVRVRVRVRVSATCTESIGPVELQVVHIGGGNFLRVKVRVRVRARIVHMGRRVLPTMAMVRPGGKVRVMVRARVRRNLNIFRLGLGGGITSYDFTLHFL